MPPFIDLSHAMRDGMPGFRMTLPDGTQIDCTARIRAAVTHAQSRPAYGGEAEFELSEIAFHGSVGTYLDSPYVRWREKRDIGQLTIEELVAPGCFVDLSATAEPDAGFDLPEGLDLAGCALLVRFGWDRYWGQELYRRPPFLSEAALTQAIEGGARLVGVDTLNIDDRRNPKRPAHSRLLERDIFIVENLCGLERLAGLDEFRFFAVPIKAVGASSMPIRAFAEVIEQK